MLQPVFSSVKVWMETGFMYLKLSGGIQKEKALHPPAESGEIPYLDLKKDIYRFSKIQEVLSFII